MSIIIPPEIYEKIFSYVCDSKTYKNLRMSCRMFHAILNDIKKFEFIHDHLENISGVWQHLREIQNGSRSRPAWSS